MQPNTSFAGWETMNQTGVAASVREIANQLIAFESGLQSISDADENATCRVCEKLRRPLITLAGTAGFSSLARSGLWSLARREAPALDAVSVEPDGSLKGLEGAAALATPVLVAHLLNLLITFIGQTLTIRLLHDIWPDMPLTGQPAIGKESQ
jgi:hypothetical protein